MNLLWAYTISLHWPNNKKKKDLHPLRSITVAYVYTEQKKLVLKA